MKKISLLVVAFLFISSIALASPLTDYSLGKSAVDITWFSNLHMTDQYTSILNAAGNGTDAANGKHGNLDLSLTTGLGGKWAIQYRQFNPETKDYTTFGRVQRFGVRSQELDALYKIDKNLSAFVGWHQARYTYDSINANTTASNKNVVQVGLVGTTQIATKTQLYGVGGVGKDLVTYEIGVSYEIAKGLDFNLLYRYKKVENLDDATFGIPYRDNVTVKGLGYGITYKF